MDFHRFSFLNILAFTLPLFCLLISWAASTTAPPSPPPSTVQAVSQLLRTRGYSFLASTLSATNTNFSGTILAPPDFAFSPNRRRVPQRPSPLILLYHTLRAPLAWRDLSSIADGSQLRTLFNGNCLFLKNSNGELSISGSKKPFLASVRIRQPDMYDDGHIVVHGIDGVLDPTSASRCSVPMDPPRVDRKLLDHAVRAMRRRGFTVAASALSVKRSEMLRLDAVSLFAPSDRVLFSKSGGFRFNFRSHVLPQRHRFEDLARYPPKITTFETLAANRTLMVDSVGGAVTVNGVHVNSTEVYQNRWIVVLSVLGSLEDAAKDAPDHCNAVEFPAPSHTPASEPPSQCRISDFPTEIEGGDLLCPAPASRTLLEGGSAEEEEEVAPSASAPLDEQESGQRSVDSGEEGEKDQMSAPPLVNIADDLFFYS